MSDDVPLMVTNSIPWFAYYDSFLDRNNPLVLEAL